MGPKNSREIRVFVSSTFRDMQQERDYLVKEVFPKLKNLCEKRGVIWGEVDLRWGINTEDIEDEAEQEREVLKTCLAEIKRCRPYFIGLLGERYGYVPNQQDLSAYNGVQNNPPYSEKSITELEIEHGVLKNSKMRQHAFFYFRSPDLTEKLVKKSREHFFEIERAKEKETLGPEKAARLAEERRNKLKNLKGRIQDYHGRGKCALLRNYESIEMLGEQVLKDFTAVIEQNFPQSEFPDTFSRYAQEHAFYARRFTQFYHELPEIDAKMDAFISSMAPTGLLISGESGIGKTALVVNWLKQFQEKNPDSLVLSHFVGANAESTDWQNILRRFYRELQPIAHVDEAAPDPAHELRGTFANVLNMAAMHRKIILLIDGLDQLTDEKGGQELIWLPRHLPQNVYVIVTAAPGKACDELQKRNWKYLSMPLLVASGVRKFTITYLKTKFSRELSADQLEKIQLAEMTRNPLYLTLLLNELRLFGEYEKLTAKIQEYLCAGTISELFKAILTRFEADYASEKPCLIGRLFSALALSRRGLSENELREIAGDPGQAVPAFKWSPIFLASEDALLNQGGRLVPAHNYILQAIHEKYLPDKASEVRVRRKIAAAFENSPDFEPTSVSPRQAEEYPWQLFQMGEYSKLLEFISDPVSFVRLRKSFFPDLKMYWTRLVKWDPRALMARYSATIRSPRGYSNEFKTALAELFFDQGDFEKAAVLRTALLKDSPQDTDQKRHLANIHFHQGHHKKARKCYEALVGQCRESEDAYGLQKALGNQAVVLRHLQKFNQALEILAEQENVCRQLSEARGLMKCYGNRANVYKAQQKFELALEMHRQEEAICQELNDQKALQICYGNQSIAQFELGHRNEAAVLFEKERDICDLLGDDLGLQAALANRGNMLFDKSPDESLKLFQEQLALARKIEYPKGEQNACYNCGMALIQLNRFTEAQDMLTAAKKICKKYDFMPELKLVKWQLNRLRRHCC